MYVPTWDRIETREGESMYGLFTSAAIEFRDAGGQRRSLPYRDIAEVRLAPGGFFADASDATIRTLRGELVKTRIAHGELAPDRFGVVQRHKLRNLTRIVPGVARLRHRHGPNGNGQTVGSKMRPMPSRTLGRG